MHMSPHKHHAVNSLLWDLTCLFVSEGMWLKVEGEQAYEERQEKNKLKNSQFG